MNHPFSSLIDAYGVVILDGGLATELERRGAPLDNPLWSATLLLDDPKRIRDVHLDYFKAGANVATTATYQATLPGLLAKGLTATEAAHTVRHAVTMAGDARNRYTEEFQPAIAPLIAGSCGSYGAYLADGSEFRGNFGRSVSELVDFHRPRVEWLLEAGVDCLAFETIPCQPEAEAIALLLAEYPDAPAWISFSCRDANTVHEGQSLAECARSAAGAPNVVAIGINCTDPQHVPGILQHLASATDRLLLAYPNSGEDWDSRSRAWRPMEPSIDFAEAAKTWRQAGARLIGGCCRTTPDTIRAITLALKPRSATSD